MFSFSLALFIGRRSLLSQWWRGLARAERGEAVDGSLRCAQGVPLLGDDTNYWNYRLKSNFVDDLFATAEHQSDQQQQPLPLNSLKLSESLIANFFRD